MEKWEASELAGTKFAERHGLALRSLYWWRARLESEAEVNRAVAPHKAFTEVRVRTAEPSRPSGTIEIVARGGRVIRVVGRVDAEQLRAVVEAVEGC